MRIALVSDTHFARDDMLTRENWDVVARWLHVTAPDLTIHLGDVTANGVHHPENLVHARELLRAVPSELLLLPGNHDIGDHAPKGGLHPTEPIGTVPLTAYREVFGPDRWTRVLGGWRLVGLNAQLLSSGLAEEEEQFAWLAATLREGQGPLALFIHKPLFRDAANENAPHTRYVPRPARRRLLEMLAPHDLRLVAAGHTHQLRRLVAGGVEHVWVPSTAFTLPDMLQERIGEKRVGVTLLQLDGDSHAFIDVRPDGLRANDLMQFTHLYPELNELAGARR